MSRQSSSAFLLAPGIRFVQNLKFAEKFLLIFLLLLIPLTYASYYLLDDVYQHAQEKQLELDGLQYAVQVSALLELIPQHRGMANGLLQGDERFRARITALQPALEKALADADAADRRWGAELQLHKPWQQIRSRWLELYGGTRQLAAEASWQQHTALIADYLDLIFRITINSPLYTEDDPATRHLMEVNFHYLPQLIEALGQLRGSGSGMIADGKISDWEHREFVRLMSAVSALSREVKRNMGFAFEQSPPLQNAFSDPANQAVSQAEWYAALVQAQVLQPAAPAISAPLYFDRGTEAISSGYRLLKMTTEYNQRSFEQDIRHLNHHRNTLIISFVLGMLIIGYLIMAFYSSIRHITDSLENVVDHLQRGEAPQEVALPGRDELGNIVQLFNQLSGQLIRTNTELRRSHREDQLLGDLSLLALQNDNLNQFAQAALPLIAAAAEWLPCKPAGQINLVRGDKSFYAAATLGMESVDPANATHLAEMHIERMAGNNILCLPFMIGGECVGELLLPLTVEILPPDTQLFLLRLTDAIAISIGRLSAESALQQREADLLRSNEELERFAYISSHDLQEPLRKIRSFGDRLLSSVALDGRSLDFLQRMVAAAGRMQELIEDLLMYSRVNASQRPFVPTDLNQVVAEACNALELQIEETHAAIRVDPLPAIEADKIQMVQLFQNLIGNALKYRREGVPPVITITLDEMSKSNPEGGMLHLKCQDNGIGFEQQYAEQIFEAFKRLHGRGEYSGSGIGLSVCRRIVERHGGMIYATSEPGIGTCMHLSMRLSHKNA
ncbi:MAG: ATP-binding protein [Gallionella sp.]|nr:ATP-binding protein [Gallionella sp.]